MNRINIMVEDIYANLFLIAISRKHDFVKLVEETEEETDVYLNGKKESFFPKGGSGLYFTELLARKMGSSLGEAYSLSQERREEMLQSLLENINPISDAYEICYDQNEDGSTEFQGYISVLNAFDEEGVKLYIDHPSDVLKSCVFSFYKVTFRRVIEDADNNLYTYSIHLSTDDELYTDYIYSDYKVWSGTDGFFADFIEKVIIEYTNTHSDSKKDVRDDEEDASKSVLTVKQSSQFERIDLEEKPKTVDELVVSIWDDTRTVEILDKFEGYSRDSTVYHHIVIKNSRFHKRFNKKNVGFNLVIERGRGLDYTGNITFTDFKKGYTTNMRKHIENEITEEIVEQYLDKDKFYRFSKPYLLRAQNSSNRTGYGWEWDWSDGIGSYTEGTLYGETTNYFFVGAYVTSGFEAYEPTKRKPFLENEEDFCHNNKKVIDSSKIRIYEGKIRDITLNKTVQMFFDVNTESGVKHVPVSFDENNGAFYIHTSHYNKYRNFIENADYKMEATISG